MFNLTLSVLWLLTNPFNHLSNRYNNYYEILTFLWKLLIATLYFWKHNFRILVIKLYADSTEAEQNQQRTINQNRSQFYFSKDYSYR